MKRKSNNIIADEMDLSSYVISPGIYFLYQDEELIYIGKAQNISRRIIDHLCEGTKVFNKVKYQLVPVDSLNEVESVLIKSLRPFLNVAHNEEKGMTNVPTPRNSVISLRPVALLHHMKRDGLINVKIRFTFKQKSFYVKTNFWVYQEDVDKSNIINKAILKDLRPIIDKYKNVTKFISSDKSFEYVKSKILAQDNNGNL